MSPKTKIVIRAFWSLEACHPVGGNNFGLKHEMGRKEGGIGSQVDPLSSQVVQGYNIDIRNYASSNNDVIYGAYSDESDPKNQIYAIHS